MISRLLLALTLNTASATTDVLTRGRHDVCDTCTSPSQSVATDYTVKTLYGAATIQGGGGGVVTFNSANIALVPQRHKQRPWLTDASLTITGEEAASFAPSGGMRWWDVQALASAIKLASDGMVQIKGVYDIAKGTRENGSCKYLSEIRGLVCRSVRKLPISKNITLHRHGNEDPEAWGPVTCHSWICLFPSASDHFVDSAEVRKLLSSNSYLVVVSLTRRGRDALTSFAILNTSGAGVCLSPESNQLDAKPDLACRILEALK